MAFMFLQKPTIFKGAIAARVGAGIVRMGLKNKD